MKSSHRPLKTIKKSLNPVGVLLVVSVLISCIAVTGCAQAEEMGGPQELTVEVQNPSVRRTTESRTAVDPNEILMAAELYCKSSDGRLTRLTDDRGDDIELMLLYDDERSLWRGSAAVSPCEEIVILAEDREGEGGPSYYYGMTRLAFDGSQSALVEAKPVYSLGQEGPAGGYIYHERTGIEFLRSGWRYLESAPNGWDDGAIPTAPWGFYDELTGALFDDIGQGQTLTELLCMADETGAAATVCDEATIGGKEDWFLPSGSELEALFNQLREKAIGTSLEGLAEGYFWSSVEVDETSAVKVLFSTSEESTLTSQGKNSLGIRCLPSRRF